MFGLDDLPSSICVVSFQNSPDEFELLELKRPTLEGRIPGRIRYRFYSGYQPCFSTRLYASNKIELADSNNSIAQELSHQGTGHNDRLLRQETMITLQACWTRPVPWWHQSSPVATMVNTIRVTFRFLC